MYTSLEYQNRSERENSPFGLEKGPGSYVFAEAIWIERGRDADKKKMSYIYAEECGKYLTAASIEEAGLLSFVN